jgi:type IV pilus assembly protein PilY1
MLQHKLKLILGALAAGGCVLTLHAEVAQDPLLSRTASVEPSIVFMFDDSASMPQTFVYQFGGSAGTSGMSGPGGSYAPLSPDINLIYYDPRVRYTRRINADGTFQTPTVSGVPTSWTVYFYKPATSTTYQVNNPVPMSNKGSGYPATGVTVAFPTPPSGGVQAQGTPNIVSTNRVFSVTVTNGGSYPTTGSLANPTFGAPAAGGTTATGTLVTANRSIVTGVTLNSARTYTGIASGTVCPWTADTGTAAGTATITGSPRRATSFTITNPGSSYAAAPTIRVSCPGNPVQTYASTVNTRRVITGVNVVVRGNSYTSAPTITFPNPGTGYVQAQGTVTLEATRMIDSITVTNAGAGYTACPTAAQVTLGGAGGDVTAVVGTPTCTGTSVAGVNQKWPGTSTPSVTGSSAFFTPSYTPDSGSPLAAGATVVAYPNSASSGTSSYPKFANRTDCAGNVCTWAEEFNNYVTWYRFHRDRLNLAKTGIGLAFQPLNPTFRLGWGQINVLAGDKSSGPYVANNNNLDKGVRLYNGTVQSEFLTWLYSLQGDVTATPNREALYKVGNYFKRRDDAGPWGPNTLLTGSNSTNASTGTANDQHASCRRAYAMLMTDGYYNDSFTFPTSAGGSEWDSTSRTITATGYSYVPIGPYSDKTGSATLSNSLADIAMYYWLNDLRPDVNNSVRTTGNDPAFWQHMNFYAIGLGVDGTLDNNDPAVLASLTGNSPARTQSWPDLQTNHPRAIDDMWHATVNGRGKLISAKSSEDLNRAITQMMSDISGTDGTQSGVAVSAIAITEGARKYVPSYTPVSWAGNLRAMKLDEVGNEAGIAWEIETEVSTDPVTEKKTYSSIIPAHDARNIYVGNNSSSGARAVAFTYAAMSATLRAQMGSSTVVTEGLINYLRGSKDNEASDTSTASTTAIYRARQTRLGDIVNSTPVLVRNLVDLNYELLPTAAGTTYRTHVDAKNSRTEGVLFVGANDGMLHAFRDGTYAADGSTLTAGGAEVFAYVPYSLLPTLPQLADKSYVHRYYVDGPITESDVYLTSAGRWANVVLGSTGAGSGRAPVPGTSGPGTAVFAIDTTSLNTSVTGMNATNVMWELNPSQAAYAELGYTLGPIVAGVTPSNHWVAIFGNGYESKSCRASLFIVNVANGVKLAEIPTNVGSCTSGNQNGLGPVRIVRNASRQIIGAYAGDLQGNLWKFDLSGAGPASWRIDPNGAPLFAAGPTKPITTAPAVLPLPMRGAAEPASGYMVVFGTGKFYEVSDIGTTGQQSLYGVWDKVAFGGATTSGNMLANDALLVSQTITAAGQSGGTKFFMLSNNPVDYSGTTPKRGWKIDLPNTGQRNVYPLESLLSRFVLADTMSPSNVSTDPCSNASGGTGYLYIIDAVTGGRPLAPVLDTNGDGNVDAADTQASGIETKADGANATRQLDTGGGTSTTDGKTYADQGDVLAGSQNKGTTKVVTESADDKALGSEFTCLTFGDCDVPGGGTTRRQWRQLYLR